MNWISCRLIGISAACVVGAFAPTVNAQTYQELAQQAVVELCPELMEIETPLGEVERVIGLGYKSVATREHPRMGTLDVVEIDTDGGHIMIANSRTASFCQVGLEGAGARSAYEAIYADRANLDPTLVPDNSSEAPNPSMTLVTLRTPPIDGVYYGVQFMDMSDIDQTAPLIVQQYLLSEN
ncbi:hypothetical protein E3U23_05430 [Erythrobacter litoralis]|uniref:hypothetical protein n=1 Tax=Erythrobacter litoralis TaxID=39960 RepID=UPI002435E215|nr:hypothetical protein [Erythrobacter litoralis]MDG6078633.1 hypothetical protein [Erythrobacter litoralis]